MNRRLFVAAAVACTAPERVRAQELKRILVGSAPTEDLLAALLGRDDGSFRKAGRDVTIQKANSGGAVTAAVIGGALQIGKSSTVPLIAARVKGIPLVVLAPAAIYNADAPAVGLVVAKNSPIRTAKDCNGRTFSVAASTRRPWTTPRSVRPSPRATYGFRAGTSTCSHDGFCGQPTSAPPTLRSAIPMSSRPSVR